MNKHLTTFAMVVTLFGLVGCKQTDQARADVSLSCDSGKVKLLADFPTARMNECTKTGDNEFSIILKPENTPINSSPWYAFRVVTEEPSKITVNMMVEGDVHRYLPKQSTDLLQWSLLDYQDKGEVRSFNIELKDKETYIAGQEILNNQFYVDWGKQLSKQYDLSFDTLGYSIEQRPIYKLESHSATSNKWLVILGRMHPPEITGALALFPFVDALLAEHTLAQEFRQDFNILIVPNLNPDGVAAGNWRHNLNGVDLNRDWKNFKQPEVKAVHQYLQQLTKGGSKMSMAVDFHSTRRDIFYTMPNDYDVEQRFLVNNWLGSLDKKYPNFSVIQKPGNNPNKGVFKQYFADQYKVHAITYEMGDNTDRGFIKKLAKDAADTLMKTMLEDNKEAKHD